MSLSKIQKGAFIFLVLIAFFLTPDVRSLQAASTEPSLGVFETITLQFGSVLDRIHSIFSFLPQSSAFSTLSDAAQNTPQVAATAFGTGKVWQVGPTKQYTKPSQVAALVQDGDTVEIDAGVYECDTGVKWTKNNLTLKGVGGRAHLKAEGCGIPGGKGIWNPTAQNLIIENIEFSGARVGDRNGAGIRHDGGGEVIIRNSYFHHNENGILFTPKPDWALSTTLTIEFTEFAYNGYGDGQTHNLYINRINKLIFRYNYSHHANVGHLLKSRARENHVLYNRLVDMADGNSSYNIDLPNGGSGYIIGNVIQQGPRSENRGIIAYAAEGLTNDGRINQLYIVNNTIHDLHPGVSEGLKLFNGTKAEMGEVKLINNLFTGFTTTDKLVGITPAKAVLVNNETVDSSGFSDLSAFNYYLKADASAIDAGINPGTVNGVSLIPVEQYLHSTNKEPRTNLGSGIDLGAYEYTGSVIVAPTLTFTVGEETVDYNSTVQLSWNTKNAEQCVASGGWSGNKSPSGSESSKVLTFNETFSIRCDGRGGSVSDTVTVTVRENPAVANFADYAFERIPGTKIRPLCTKGFPYDGTVGCDGKGGNSSTVYVPDNNTLYLAGGGSRNYFGNEVFALDLDSNELSKVFGPTDPRDTTNFNTSYTWSGDIIKNCTGVWDLKSGGVVPPPLQPFSAFMYLPEHGKIYMHGGMVACGVSANTTAGWLFDIGSNSWELAYRSSAGPTWSHGAYVEEENLAVVVGSNGFFRYDPTANTLTKVSGASAPYAYQGRNAVYDPRHKLLLFMGFYGNEESFSVIDLNGVDAESTTLPARQTDWTVTGDTTLLRKSFPGLAYDSVNGHLVGWDGKDKIYFIELDPQTKTANFIAKRISGGPTVSNGGVGTFRYAPQEKAFVLFSDVDEDFFLLKETRSASGAIPNPSTQTPARKPVTCNMNTVPGTITKGQTATLSWNTKNATNATLSEGIGSVGTDDSRTVAPEADTTYTLTATGAEGTVTCAAKINVKEPTTSGNNSANNGSASTSAIGNTNVENNSTRSSGGGKRISLSDNSNRQNDNGSSRSGGTSISLSRNLARGSSGSDVRKLQEMLNNDPTTRVAQNGNGSVGNESTYFGAATEAALKRFQTKHGIIAYGTPATTGYGALGPKTRAKLQELYGSAGVSKVLDTSSREELRAQLAVVLTQLEALRAQLQTLQQTESANNSNQTSNTVERQSSTLRAQSFIRTLKSGDQNAQVSLLQYHLATDAPLYPEGMVTGYYGTLTEQAVERFQRREGIIPAIAYGTVDEQTRKRLNEVYGNVLAPVIR